MKQIAPNLSRVQETSLLTLWAKAVENRQPKPIIYSPKADEVAAGLDYEFSQFGRSTLAQTALCVRARLLDEWVRQFLQRYPSGTVIEVGAGLDARFERLDNGQLTWFDVDLPEVTALRQQFFQAGPRRHSVGASILEQSWLQIVRAKTSGPWLLVAEGVLPYLTEADVRRFFFAAAAALPGMQIAFDVYAPWVCWLTRWTLLRHFSARLMWGISDLSCLQDVAQHYRLVKVVQFSDFLLAYRDRFPFVLQLLGENISLLDRGVRLVLMQLPQ